MNDGIYFDEQFPFLTGLWFQGKEIICIVQNCDEKIITFYDISTLRTVEDRRLFLELGETWWWESSRKLPINIFLLGEMKRFRYCLKTVNKKETEHRFGPMTSLTNIMEKRVKRKRVILNRILPED